MHIKIVVIILLPLLASLASADEPPTTPILRIETGMHSAMIRRIDMDRSGRWLVSASDDKTVRVWDLNTGSTGKGQLERMQPAQILRPPIGKGDEGKLFSVAISPDGNLVATGGWTVGAENGGDAIYIFSRKYGRLIGKARGLPDVISQLAFSPDGRYLGAILGGKNGLRLFRVDTTDGVGAGFKSASNGLHLIAQDTDYGNDSYGAHISPDGRRLVTSSWDGYVRVYDLETVGWKQVNGEVNNIKPIAKQKMLGGKKPYAVKFSPDGAKIAVGFEDSTQCSVLSARDLSLLYAPNTSGVTKGNYYGLVWSRDGKRLYAGGRAKINGTSGYIRRWSDSGHGGFKDFKSGSINTIMDLASMPDGRIAFGGGGPFIGIFESDGAGTIGQSHLQIPPQMADYRDNWDGFQLSADGTVVTFGYKGFGEEPATFSLTNRNLSSLSLPMVVGKRTSLSSNKLSGGEGLSSPDTSSLSINAWNSTTNPTINNRPIKLDQHETSRSLAIAPDRQSFLLGTEWRLRRFDRNGLEYWNVPVPGIAWLVNIARNGEVAVVAFSDGTIRWYRYADGKELIAFFPHADKKRWVLWTPEGYFDASPGGAELIGYHINQGKDKEARFVPMSYLYDVFYRPDIVQAKFKGEDISSLITLTAEEALKTPPPEVKFTTIPSKSAEKAAKVCYQIKSTGGGIGEVRLFQNGKLIKSDGFYRETAKKEASAKIQLASMNSRAIYQDQRGLVVREKKTANAAISKPKGDLVDECVEIETITGENEISLAAFNAPNTVQGFMETATFVSTRKGDEPHLYILSVGIDTYRDSSINLKYAAKDAKDFISKLPEKARSIYKPQNIHIVTLTNQQADKQSILKAIDDLSAKIKHGDGFIFFNASHGVLLQNQYYIVTAGFDGNLNDANSLIGSNEIVEMSKRIKSLSQLFIFDTCHAGGVDNIVSGLYDARMSVLAKKMGLHIYASAGSVQTAMDGYQGNGLYTHTLLQGIANGKQVDKEKAGKVTVKSLGLYTKEKTTEISTKLGHPQTPFIINFGRDNPLFVVR